MKFLLNIAEIPMHVTCPVDIKEMCGDYAQETNGKPDAMENITIRRADIENEHMLSRKRAAFTALHRKVSNTLSRNDGVVIHGVLLSCEGKGVLLIAPSGTGKTTHALLWKSYIEGSSIINGDKPAVRIINGKVYGYGTCWAGKENFEKSEKVEITHIVVFRRGKENSIKRLEQEDANKAIMRRAHLKNEALLKGLKTCMKISEKVVTLEARCNMSEEAVRMVYENTVKGGKKS